MAKAITMTCDNCGAEITEKNPVIAKLFLTPVLKSQARADHGSYSRHCDIGQCCVTAIVKNINWTKRLTRAEYQDSRKTRPANGNGRHPANAVATSTKRAASKAK